MGLSVNRKYLGGAGWLFRQTKKTNRAQGQSDPPAVPDTTTPEQKKASIFKNLYEARGGKPTWEKFDSGGNSLGMFLNT